VSDDTIRELLVLRKRFQRLHREGMTALRANDLDSLSRVIRQERELFAEQAQLIRTHTKLKAASTRRGHSR
jgi:hypothetical protein